MEKNQTYDKKVVDESRLEGTISLVIDDFSSFRFQKDDRFSKEWCIINNVPWRFQSKVDETEDHDLGIGFYVGPSIFDKELNTKITFQYIQTLALVVGRFLFYLKDALIKENGVYNKNNESITLKATIKIR